MVKGEPNAPVLVVMPNPISENMEIWFYEKMLECGIKQNDIRLIYILEEQPANSGNRPSVEQIRLAVTRVKEEIQVSTPKVVIPLGKDAIYVTTGLKVGIEDARGYLIRPDLRGSFVYETWEEIGKYKTASKKTGRVAGDPKFGWVKRATKGLLPEAFTGYVIPAYTMEFIRTMAFAVGPAFKADIMRAKRALDGKLKIVDEAFTYDVSLSNIDWNFNHSAYLALDIETAGPSNDTIERIGLSDGVHTVTLPWNAAAEQYVQQEVDAVTEAGGWIIFHNLPFDYPRLCNAGIAFNRIIRAGRVFDSMYGAATVQPDLRKGLGSVASFYLDNYPWKWHPEDNPERYNALDAFKTVKILEDGIEPLAKQLRMWPLLTGENYKYGPGIMKTIPVLSDMTERGLKINRPYAIQWEAELQTRLRELVDKWSAILPECDPGSNKQVAQLLYYQWKLPVVRNKEDGITTDEYAIVKTRAYIQSDYAKIKDKNPWKEDARCTPELFTLLLNIRETNKQLGTYCTPLVIEVDDYVHPSYLPLSKWKGKDADDDHSKGTTATGRLAASRPNIQNQPKIARHLFVPDTDFNCFVQFDYSKAELFAMAAMSDDSVMYSDLSSDPYQKVADAVGTDRKTAKNVVLAGQYLAGAQKVSDMILKQQHFYVSPTECKRILDGIAKRWVKRTGYVRWLCLQVQNKKRAPYLINPFGRVRIFHDRRAAAAVDFIPQSIVADMLWCVLKDVSDCAAALGGRLTTTVHDSILVQVAKDVVEIAATEIKTIMERKFDCVRPGFFIPVGCEIGKPGAAWGTLA